MRSVELKVEDGWNFDLNEFESAFNERTTMFLLTNPHNPTGKVFSREEL